jgi:hypothetical protein
MKLPASIFIKDQLPQHIVDNNPLFAAFIEAYYEWLDIQDEESGMSRGIIELRDIDNTIDQFVDFLISDILTVNVPEIAVDKRLFLKHLQDIFAAKGTEKSFRLFFRMFYDVDIQVLYPSENILRASDGEWEETFILTTDLVSGDIDKLPGAIIIGQTSGAMAGVENVETVFINNVLKYIIRFNDNFSGQFLANEHIKALVDTDDELEFIINKTVQTINIVNGGMTYAIGDVITVTSATGHGAKAFVSNVTPPVLIKLNAPYSKIGTTVTIDCGTKYHLLVSGDSLFLDFKSGIQSGNYIVSNIVSNFIFQIEVDPAETIVSNFVDVYNANTSGVILQVSVLDGGYGYDDATFSIDSDNGTGATLAGVFGAYAKLPGQWSSNRGLISNALTVLQDNLKYQQFSYVIQSSESIIRWRELFKKLVHPAGMEVFSETIISLSGETDVVAVDPEYKLYIYDEIEADLTEIEFVYQIYARASAHATGYTTLEELKRVLNNLPPVTTEEQFNLDIQDSLYEGRSNYNYDGTVNAGYWGTVQTFDTDITFGSMPWGANAFAGYFLKFQFKARNFRPEDYYTQDEIQNEIDISDRVIAIPDSTIKIIKISTPSANPPEIRWPFPPV